MPAPSTPQTIPDVTEHIETGSGSELRRPLGITIIGGLMVSQVFTLYTTPCVYLAFSRLAARLRVLRVANVIDERELAEER